MPGAAYVVTVGASYVLVLALLLRRAARRGGRRLAVFATLHGLCVAPSFAVDGWRAETIVYHPSLGLAFGYAETHIREFLCLLLGGWCVMFFVARWVASDKRAWESGWWVAAASGTLGAATLLAVLGVSYPEFRPTHERLTNGLAILATVGWVAAVVAVVAAWSVRRRVSRQLAVSRDAVHEGEGWVRCDGQRLCIASAAHVPVGPVVVEGLVHHAGEAYRVADAGAVTRVVAGSRASVARNASDVAISYAAYAVTCLLVTFPPMIAATAASGLAPMSSDEPTVVSLNHQAQSLGNQRHESILEFLRHYGF